MNTSAPPPAPGDAPGAPPPQQDGLDRFFASLRGAGLYRSEDERWIGGVCAGIAERLRVDPLIIRAAFVLLGLVFGAGITLYLVAWILLPDRSGTILLQRAARGRDMGALVLVIVVACIALSGFGLFWGWGGPGPIVPVLLVVGVLIYLLGKQNRTDTPAAATPPPWNSSASGSAPQAAASAPSVGTPPDTGPAIGTRAVVPYGAAVGEASVDHPDVPDAPRSYTATSVGTEHDDTSSAPPTSGESTPPGVTPPAPGPAGWQPVPPPPPRPRRRRLGAAATMILLGVAAIVGSVTILITNNTGLSDVSVRLGIAATTVTVGVGVVAAGFAGRRAGFASFVGLLLALTTAASAAIPKDLSLDGPHGEVEWAPTSVSRTTYAMGAGEGRLDLRGLDAPVEPTTITTRAAVGSLRIVVPDDLSVRIKAHVDAGNISTRTLGDSSTTSVVAGGDRSHTFTYGGSPDLTIKAEIGLGEIIIERTTP